MSKSRIPKLRGTQVGLKNPQLVDHIKADMKKDQYAFDEPRGRIGGVVDRRGVYHVIEGHHRLPAAREIWLETGNSEPLRKLLQLGNWSLVAKAPHDSRPLPARSFWGNLRNWIGF